MTCPFVKDSLGPATINAQKVKYLPRLHIFSLVDMDIACMAWQKNLHKGIQTNNNWICMHQNDTGQFNWQDKNMRYMLCIQLHVCIGIHKNCIIWCVFLSSSHLKLGLFCVEVGWFLLLSCHTDAFNALLLHGNDDCALWQQQLWWHNVD